MYKGRTLLGFDNLPDSGSANPENPLSTQSSALAIAEISGIGKDQVIQEIDP
jgi:hypothetical protein